MIDKETAIELAKRAGFAWSERQTQEVEIEKLCNLAIAHAQKDAEPVAFIFKPNRKLLWPNEVEAANPIEIDSYTPLYTYQPDQAAIAGEKT